MNKNKLIQEIESHDPKYGIEKRYSWERGWFSGILRLESEQVLTNFLAEIMDLEKHTIVDSVICDPIQLPYFHHITHIA